MITINFTPHRGLTLKGELVFHLSFFRIIPIMHLVVEVVPNTLQPLHGGGNGGIDR